MEKTELRPAPIRRVGTFTFGVVLVLAGCAMLAAMFFPRLDLTWAIKLAPAALVSLGIETLLAARNSEKIRYDWVGMILCCFIVCTALVLFVIAWFVIYYPDRIGKEKFPGRSAGEFLSRRFSSWCEWRASPRSEQPHAWSR